MHPFPLLLFSALSVPALALQDAASWRGAWSGRVHLSGTAVHLKLDLEPAANAWSGRLELELGGERLAMSADDLAIGARTLRFRAPIEGAIATFEAEWRRGMLAGTMQAVEGQQIVGSGRWGALRADGEASDAVRLEEWLAGDARAPTAEEIEALVKSLDALLDTSYVLADGAARARAAIQSAHERGAFAAARSGPQLAQLVTEQLYAATRDRHLQLEFEAAIVPSADPDHIQTPQEREQELERERASSRLDNHGFRSVAILDGNVGYIDLRRFRRVEVARETALAAMRFVAGADALVIDLRESGGGRPEMVAYLASFLFDGEPFVYSTQARRRDGTTTHHRTEVVPDELRSGSRPLYVLTAQRTFSAAEAFVYELRARKRATIVGETTGGGAHSGATFRVIDHYAVFLPLSRSISPVDGGEWEGTGVAPHVAVPAVRALDTAHALAVEALAARATSEEQRAALQSILLRLRGDAKSAEAR